MIPFYQRHPKANPELHLGLIPYFLDRNNPRPAAEQFDDHSFGGGWRKTDPRWRMLPDGSIKYPNDPALPVLFEASLRDEVIRVYESAWVAIVQPDGSFQISRMD
jgi:hypothetical protein